jgi:hypothetical protein
MVYVILRTIASSHRRGGEEVISAEIQFFRALEGDSEGPEWLAG